MSGLPFLLLTGLVAEALACVDARADPARFHRESRARPALIIAGASIFATGYSIALAFAFGSRMQGTSPWLAIPIAGPVGVAIDDAGQKDGCPLRIPGTDCNAFSPDVLFVTSSILQLAGATMFALGFVRHDVWRRNASGFVFQF
jgi:hypothetical protein